MAVGEAFFVPRNDCDNNVSDGDDGYLLTCAYNTKESHTDLVVIDAKSMEKVATMRYDALLPLGFHCGWLDDVETSQLRP